MVPHRRKMQPSKAFRPFARFEPLSWVPDQRTRIHKKPSHNKSCKQWPNLPSFHGISASHVNTRTRGSAILPEGIQMHSSKAPKSGKANETLDMGDELASDQVIR